MFKKVINVLPVVIGLVIFVFSFGTAFAGNSSAGPIAVSYDGDGPLFSENNISPSQDFVKTLTIKNTGSVNHSFAIATKNVVGDLSGNIFLKPSVLGEQIWSVSVSDLSNLPTQSKTVISSIEPGQTVYVELKAEFQQTSNNSYQNKNVTFDIVYGTEEVEPIPTSSATTTTLTGLISTVRSFFNAIGTTSTPAPSSTPSLSANATTSPTGEVKGEQTSSDSGLNPWYLVIAPAAVIASFIFLPEFAFAGGMAAISGGATYILGYTSKGDMDPTTFYIILIIEIITLIVLTYFMLHHDNRASRKIKGYHHRLRIR